MRVHALTGHRRSNREDQTGLRKVKDAKNGKAEVRKIVCVYK